MEGIWPACPKKCTKEELAPGTIDGVLFNKYNKAWSLEDCKLPNLCRYPLTVETARSTRLFADGIYGEYVYVGSLAF